MTIYQHAFTRIHIHTRASLDTNNLEGTQTTHLNLLVGLQSLTDNIEDSRNESLCLLGRKFVLLHQNSGNITQCQFLHCSFLLSSPLLSKN